MNVMADEKKKPSDDGKSAEPKDSKKKKRKSLPRTWKTRSSHGKYGKAKKVPNAECKGTNMSDNNQQANQGQGTNQGAAEKPTPAQVNPKADIAPRYEERDHKPIVQKVIRGEKR
jgi:hypothetical protein